ncbi:serine carboxypeptidase [Crepidotus variabilis]|uniref:Serine carboxypeptidase n=1 Tax=Crepidotus variabilis TaxID=179855 RepID=A0A9P6E5N1_9AGAR|nr:serine carboxypeptidase [Crepidotus variabilis]
MLLPLAFCLGLITSSCFASSVRVVENSGVCETTPGVYQASGYVDLSPTQSIWFWFFAARNDPSNAPLSLWFNGGPGVSSMGGIVQEHGPCRITNDSSSLLLNPNSWNTRSNMLYIDQPIGAGFSKGDSNVTSSQEAAEDIWKFLQLWFEDDKFKKYAEKPLALWTESFGGHFGSAFGAHFLKQNDAIDSGKTSGKKINLKVLGIGNGLIDPLLQFPGYLQYAGGENLYHPEGMVNKTTLAKATKAWNGTDDGCQSKIKACYDTGTDDACEKAQTYCNKHVLKALYGPWDPYYIAHEEPDPYPPKANKFLNDASFKKQIGAEGNYTARSKTVGSNFKKTGDWMRNLRPDLEYVINSGVRTLLFDGDADFVFNYIGFENMVDGLQTKFLDESQSQEWTDYAVQGQITGKYKAAGGLSYLRVYGAGHKVAAYKYGNLGYGEAALQFFNQITVGNGLQST